MIKRHLRELSKSFVSQIGPEKSQEFKITKTDIENNLSRVLKLIKGEEDNSKKETEFVGLIDDFYNQYQSLYVLYGRLTGEYMRSSPRRVKRVSNLSSSSSDTEYFSSDETEFSCSDYNSRTSQKEHYSSFVNTLKALKTQKSKERNEMKQLREKNVELEKAVSMLHVKLMYNEEHVMSKTSDLMARINKLEQEAKSLRKNKCKMEEKIKRCRNETLNQKKEFSDQINVMQQKFESLEDQLENEREKVSEYMIWIKNLEHNLDETESDKQNQVKEKQCLIERINNLEEKLQNATCEINIMQKQKSELESQTEELMERKMEELAERVQQKIENDIRILYQRINAADQMNKENNDSYKLTLQKHEEEKTIFGEKVDDYEDEIMMLKEKVWKLEAVVSKEGGKNMNLMKTVTQFERKMRKLEKELKEKDDALVSLGESKKEAIRQLCFLVEFHRDRCLYLKEVMLKMRVQKII